ncbi:hypothetical protein AALO_G00302310 [Alosa alosa]|uniref:Uncharacterized protein n=1 Tax=Alosa alosa TaxID=278164 RepID=A0AAV6FFR8_9TELE|nr:hypothetical protein AALO_G00302310 [Alosa alosa]
MNDVYECVCESPVFKESVCVCVFARVCVYLRVCVCLCVCGHYMHLLCARGSYIHRFRRWNDGCVCVCVCTLKTENVEFLEYC